MKLLLATLHAKYSHASLALPCLASSCSTIPDVEIIIREWTVNEPREHILRQIIAQEADIVAFSCYIWNIENTLRIAADIKKIAAHTVIILGGPEASFGVFELMYENPAVDFVVKGEGEAIFSELLGVVAARDSQLPEQFSEKLATIGNLFFRDDGDIVSGPTSTVPLQLDSIPSPFEAGLVDLGKPLVYYETSRGCPFSCAFCLSSLEGQVRSFSPQRIESDLLFLMKRNVPQIKLVDRTFNYDARRANVIWEYILEHNRGSHFHFEIAADLLTDDNLNLLSRVPPHTFRFEIGVQSTSRETLERVARKTDLGRICENVRRLRNETEVELHLDLVAGLPGENYGGLLSSLQQVADLKPHVIQIEPLKVLKGSPMREIAKREEYRHSDSPPYTILSTPWLSFNDIGRVETIGRMLDLFHNHGGFDTALEVLATSISFAELFASMAENVEGEQLFGLSRQRLYELFYRLVHPIIREQGNDSLLADALFFDFCRTELPRQGKLPSFITTRARDCRWPGGSNVADLNLPAGTRSKSFSFPFARDYRLKPWEEEYTEMTFVYSSSQGGGLRINIL